MVFDLLSDGSYTFVVYMNMPLIVFVVTAFDSISGAVFFTRVYLLILVLEYVCSYVALMRLSGSICCVLTFGLVRTLTHICIVLT